MTPTSRYVQQIVRIDDYGKKFVQKKMKEAEKLSIRERDSSASLDDKS